MRMIVLLFGLLLAARASALTFGTTCANPCGVEEMSETAGSATCTIIVGHDSGDGFDPLVVQDAEYIVHHADGDETVFAAGTPVSLMFGGQTQAALPVVITEHPGDETLPNGLTVGAVAHCVALFNGIPTAPFEESFGDRMVMVPQSTCVVAGAAVPTTTTTTTTTTLPRFNQPRMHVCIHNGHPQKCN